MKKKASICWQDSTPPISGCLSCNNRRGSFPTNVIAHLHGLSMDLTAGRTVGPTADATVVWTVGLTVKLCKHWFDSRSNYWSNCGSHWPTIVRRTQASDASGRLPRYEAKCLQRTRFQWGVGPFACRYQARERSYPLPIYWYHSKGNWLRYNFGADSFIMKLCSRLLVLYCRHCLKDDKFRYFIPI